MGLTQVNSGGIEDGSIVNADIKSDSAIALSKLASTPAVLTGSTDNTICTVTGANAIQGEANLTFDGSTLTASGNVFVGRTDNVWNSRLIAQEDKQGRTQILVKNDTDHADASSCIALNAHGNSWVMDCGSGAKNSNALTFAVDASSATPTERLRIDSSGRVLIGTTTEGEASVDDLTISSSGDTGITIRSGTTSNGAITFSDGTSGADEYRGMIDYDHDTNILGLYTNATEKLRVESGGNVKVTDGDLVIGTAGHGILFSNWDTVVNRLDDYEVGTFTPTVHSGMNNSTLSTSDGSYTKIGRLVTYQLNMTISGGTANSSQLQFGGLPFAANGTTANAYGGATLTYQDDMFNKGEDITFHTGSGETLIKCYKQDGAALVGTDGAIDDITTQILLHGQYYT